MNRCSLPSLFQAPSCCSLAAVRLSARLRSTSWTMQVDADLLPLLPDHLGDLRELDELAAERHDLDAQAALPSVRSR